MESLLGRYDDVSRSDLRIGLHDKFLALVAVLLQSLTM
jgi:hypothetical protein